MSDVPAHHPPTPGPGRHLALVVGLGLFGGAAYVALTGKSPILATILVLTGANALVGWLKSSRRT